MYDIIGLLVFSLGLLVSITLFVVGWRVWHAPTHHYKKCHEESNGFWATLRGDTAGGELSTRGLAFKIDPDGGQPRVVRQRKLAVEAIDDILRV